MTDRSSEERSRFEKWANRRNFVLVRDNADSLYMNHSTECAWDAWRAALEDRQEAPKWQRLPDEQTWWWHWNGEDLSVPHIYCVMVSKTGRDRYFIAHPDSRWCDEMGGTWLKLERPNVPERGVFKPAEDRQEAAPTNELHKEHCPECDNDWNCYCTNGPVGIVVCPDCESSETSEKERLLAQEWGTETASPGVPSEATKENL